MTVYGEDSLLKFTESLSRVTSNCSWAKVLFASEFEGKEVLAGGTKSIGVVKDSMVDPQG